jgi:hypothetical protein
MNTVADDVVAAAGFGGGIPKDNTHTSLLAC